MTDFWPAAARHEKARQAAQRAASATRYAAALQRGKEALGSYAAVAEHLGISRQAVSDALAKAERRPEHEPLADYLELDLPRAGAAVPTVQEWEALPAGEQPSAARTAAATWRMIALLCGHLADRCQEAAEAAAEVLVTSDAHDPETLLRAVSAAVPHWPAPGTPEECDRFVELLGDLAGGFRNRQDTAHREADRWALRGGQEHVGEVAAY